MKLCNQAECLSVSFKMEEILFHLFIQQFLHSMPPKRQAGQIPRKPLPDRDLSKMPERRITDIMDQPRAFQDMRDIFLHMRCKPRISPVFQNIFPYILPQRFPERRDFQRVCQPCADKITLIQREYLRFILKPAKRSAPYDPVIIFLKLTPEIRRPRLMRALPLPFRGQQGPPFHIASSSLIRFTPQALLRGEVHIFTLFIL